MTLIQILVMVAQLSTWATTLCSTAADLGFPVQRLDVRGADLQDVAPLSNDAFVIVAKGFPPPRTVDIERIDSTSDELVASIEQQLPGGDGAASVIVSDGQWWMSRESGVGESLFFVTPKGTKQLPLPMADAEVWLPVRSPTPRGMFVHVDEDLQLHFDEVTPSGLRSLGRDSWPTDTLMRGTVWSASSLPDGRFAVISAEVIPEKEGLQLWVLPGDKGMLSVPYDFAVARVLRTMADESGRIGIIAVTSKREIVAAVLDVDRPQEAKWVTLSTPGEIAADAWAGVPAIEPNGKGFIAGWIRDDGVVRACELNASNERTVVFDVGTDADTRSPLRQLIHVDGDSVTFIWKGSSGECYLRRLPNELTALATAIELRKRVCDAVRDRGVTAP